MNVEEWFRWFEIEPVWEVRKNLTWRLKSQERSLGLHPLKKIQKGKCLKRVCLKCLIGWVLNVLKAPSEGIVAFAPCANRPLPGRQNQ